MRINTEPRVCGDASWRGSIPARGAEKRRNTRCGTGPLSVSLAGESRRGASSPAGTGKRQAPWVVYAPYGWTFLAGIGFGGCPGCQSRPATFRGERGLAPVIIRGPARRRPSILRQSSSRGRLLRARSAAAAGRRPHDCSANAATCSAPAASSSDCWGLVCLPLARYSFLRRGRLLSELEPARRLVASPIPDFKEIGRRRRFFNDTGPTSLV